MPARSIAITQPDRLRKRALTIALVLVGWMVLIGARLVHLQVTQHDDLAGRARKQQLGTVETTPTRGQLLDRHGRELARSVDMESFFADPGEIENPQDVARRIASVTNLDRVSLADHLKEGKETNKKFVWIVRRLDEGVAAKLNGLNLEGIYSRKEPKRFYPNDSLAAHVLGFVGTDEVGLGGVEQFYNDRIRGESGKLYLETDAQRRAFESYEIQPHPGQTVVLTIDQTIQYRAEQALFAAVERSHAKSGTAIVMDPLSGDILALANAPAFNPNQPPRDAEERRANGALQNTYEPGSTFKIVAYSAAIEKGLARPDDKIDCQMGQITVAGRVIHDHHSFGVLTVAEALAQSSNVGAIKLGLRVGNESMFDYIRRLGFGSRTGVDLPGESAGILRPLERWQPSSIGSIAMGQEIGVTPLQMATAYSALANGGLLVKPHLVREMRSPDGTVLFQARTESRRALKTETTMALRGMLEGVTLRGTARTPVTNPAVVIIVVIDEPQGSYHGGDVAAPVFREIAEEILPDLAVTPDAQIKPTPGMPARAEESSLQVTKARLDDERQTQERKATLPKVDARPSSSRMTEVVYAFASNHGALMPDLRGQSVRDVARLCAQLGLQLEARGDGRAWRQSPAPGTEVQTGQLVSVDFGRSN